LDKGAARTGSGTTVSPDSDKVLIGVGLIHDAPGIGRISASYGWLHLRDGEVRASSIASGSLEGRVSGDVHMLGIGYTYMW
jgi:long-subunit fatty acid transport protein